MKKCSFCAEEIQDEAIKCRYCQSDLRESASTDTPKDYEKAVRFIKKYFMLTLGVLAIASLGFILQDMMSPSPLTSRLIKRWSTTAEKAPETKPEFIDQHGEFIEQYANVPSWCDQELVGRDEDLGEYCPMPEKTEELMIQLEKNRWSPTGCYIIRMWKDRSYRIKLNYLLPKNDWYFNKRNLISTMTNLVGDYVEYYDWSPGDVEVFIPKNSTSWTEGTLYKSTFHALRACVRGKKACERAGRRGEVGCLLSLKECQNIWNSSEVKDYKPAEPAG